MTEQQYEDLTDLQIMRAALTLLKQVNANKNPNKTRIKGIRTNLALSIEHLAHQGFIDA